MYGVFGGYTRWAVVFLIIFVLFFLFVPASGTYTTGAGTTVASYYGMDGLHYTTWDGGYDLESSSP
ncbi:MAG: hypothetical protein K6T63_08695 [Alicyclobacillus herbarius]|uniref:hypothetical protein n=1 Tax=Alicyclobacillus herbarius TaxID=122960 RepID=UPI00040F7944|nr:hypothetical protein [Alicyclobacillus herbarius]MCL6632700.1 hypothetical protein [Alicyclobacillus herbarius]